MDKSQNKRIHILSRSQWDEPHRIRQQIAKLLSLEFDVQYHAPGPIHHPTSHLQPHTNITTHHFPFFEKFTSLPLTTLINTLILRWHILKNTNKNDVIINFLPEFTLLPTNELTVISVFNDDFAAMAPRISSWWIKFLMKKMGRRSDAAFYVSSALMRKYPCHISEVLHPWCDQIQHRQESTKDIILYWGYMGAAVDYAKIEELATDISLHSLGIEIWLVGPLASEAKGPLNLILEKHPNIKLMSPRSLEDIPVDRVLFGIEFISPHFKNSMVLEFPNKAPRLLAYGIPLVYSGCQLLDHPFLLRYDGKISDLIEHINNNACSIQRAINDYFKTANNRSVLDRIKHTIALTRTQTL